MEETSIMFLPSEYYAYFIVNLEYDFLIRLLKDNNELISAIKGRFWKCQWATPISAVNPFGLTLLKKY